MPEIISKALFLLFLCNPHMTFTGYRKFLEWQHLEDTKYLPPYQDITVVSLKYTLIHGPWHKPAKTESDILKLS